MARHIGHVTPRYVADRLRLWWFQRSNPDAPWLTQTAIEILDSWLKPTDRGLEWGSGRSTRWLARRVVSLVSVEHDRAWYDRLSKSLGSTATVDYRFVDLGLEDGVAEYVGVAGELEDQSLDFVLVDGRRRDACALAALDLLRPGGLLVVDNANIYLPSNSRSPDSVPAGNAPATDAWNEFTARVDGWRRIGTSNGVFDTTLWVKPAARET